MIVLKWSRRESNSRPNEQPNGFLHAYSLFVFSTSSKANDSHQKLSFTVSVRIQNITAPRFIFTVPLNQTPQIKVFEGNLAFLPCRNEANLTMIQIMQQERSFLRRVKCLNFDIYEPKYNARRAYN